MATTPPLGSLSTEALAAKVRAKYPGAYDDKPDAVLVGAWLKKYPDYSGYLTPESSAQLSALGNARAAVTKPIDQLREKAFSIFTPTGDVPPEQLEATRRANDMTLTGTAALATGVPAVAGAFAPTAVAGTAGTGILDASGAEIMKQITTLGPSAARTFYSGMQAAAAAHPLAAKLMAYSLTSLGLGKIAHSLGWVGKP